MSETYSMEHDIQRLIDYAKDNWRETQVVSPDDIVYNFTILEDQNRKRLQKLCTWMYNNVIFINEVPTQYSLLDIRANADRENDTLFNVICYSKLGSHRAIRIFREFLYLMREYAHENISGHYAFLQILDSEPRRDPYTGGVNSNFLLTRRGKGHD